MHDPPTTEGAVRMAQHRARRAGRAGSIALCLTVAALGLAPVAALTTQGSTLACKADTAGMVNACATLDTTQVQDRRVWPQWTDGTYACTEEDGSAQGQPFPCRWESGSNGQGTTYTLDHASN